MESFRTRLEDFSHKHSSEIRKNAQFRRQFQEMCASVGVDPLACKLLFCFNYIPLKLGMNLEYFIF